MREAVALLQENSVRQKYVHLYWVTVGADALNAECACRYKIGLEMLKEEDALQHAAAVTKEGRATRHEIQRRDAAVARDHAAIGTVLGQFKRFTIGLFMSCAA